MCTNLLKLMTTGTRCGGRRWPNIGFKGREVMKFIGIIMGNVLPLGKTEGVIPMIMIKVDRWAGRVNSLEPVIKDDVVLRGDFAGREVEDEGNTVTMFHLLADIDAAFRARPPAGNRLAILEGLFKNIDWTTPDMHLLKFVGGPSGASEEFIRAAACAFLRDIVHEKGCMRDSKGPELNIGNFRPV